MNIKQLFIVALIFILNINAIFSIYDLFDFENNYSDESDADKDKMKARQGRQNEIILKK